MDVCLKLINIRINDFYKELKRKQYIHTEYGNLQYPDVYGFAYTNPNYYVIPSHHELSKLFLLPHMTNYDKITDGTLMLL